MRAHTLNVQRGDSTPADTVCAYDCSDWHPQCPVQLVAALGHSHGLLWCPKCRVACDLEAAATRLTYEEAERSA